MRSPYLFFFSFFVAVNQCAAANLAPQMTCNVTRTSEGLFQLTLNPAPTITDHSSYSWTYGLDLVFAANGNFSAELVQNISGNSVTLKRCVEDVVFKNNGETQQEASCHVNCSHHATTPPSASHIFCLSDRWCPPVWVLGLVLVSGLVLVLVLVSVLVRCKMKGHRCRGRSSEEEPRNYVFVKDSDTAEGSEVKQV